MIELYNASAGSGKTYTLAKRYIEYLISERGRTPDRRKLRSPRAIQDAVSRTLAITFTNKATNEMKERIVERLADLAGRVKDPSRTEYLQYFMQTCGASEREVREASHIALRELLINYSDFNVSTIDAFFQSVLRTFAYESDLSDSYQLEIDSDWTARVGVDVTLSSVNGDNPDREVIYWLNYLMEDELEREGSFDLFHKREQSRKSRYRSMIAKAKKMETEEFKKLRTALDDYFSEPDRFRLSFEAFEEFYESGREKALAKLMGVTERIYSSLKDYEGEWQITSFRNHLGRMKKTLAGNFEFTCKAELEKESFISAKVAKQIPDDVVGKVESGLLEFYSALREYGNYMSDPDYVLWRLYRENLPYLGLLQKIRSNAADFYESNNVVQLSETNSLLDRVIGDDDAPFIYERLGAHLNHFLIDEFQDTSRMQWNNLQPLLAETMSRGEENLIIGDPKQSIYRFRNADPSIIREIVPRQFDEVKTVGAQSGENTNYRSRKNIVLFNNAFFKWLTASLDAKGRNKMSLSGLYSNVVQGIHKGDTEGYVHIYFGEKGDSSDSGEEGYYPDDYRRIPSIILDILSRGYSMGDIGILVSRNLEAGWVVNALMDYNLSLGPENERERISFISEDSLAISSSKAVEKIVTALEMLESYTAEEGNKKEDKDRDAANKGKRSIRYSYSLATDLNFYRMSHPEKSLSEIITDFFNSGNHADSREILRKWCQSVALPALVEAIIGAFVPSDLRQRDAAYIAAFQDMVAEQCERYAADAPSFMQWWRRVGVKKSLSSPSGMNAVSIMTVHKAKGLDFDFVIVPSFNMNLDIAAKEGAGRKDNEWRWVRPNLKPLTIGRNQYELPPYLPIEMGKSLKSLSGLGSPSKLFYKPALPAETPRSFWHLHEYENYIDAAAMDNLNRAYVALTRAVKELYILSPRPSGNKNLRDMSEALYAFMTDESLTTEPLCLAPEQRKQEDEFEFFIGTPSPGADEEDKSRVEDPEPRDKDVKVTSYPVYLRSKPFTYREDPVAAFDEDEDPDPRSEGNQLHRLLEWIKVPDDLDRAILKMRVRGEARPSKLEEYRRVIREALAEDFTKEWFAPDLRVLNERTLMKLTAKEGRPVRLRPDRVIVRDGRAVVVDYKFGKEKRAHHAKTARYVQALRETGLFDEVEGWLWYVHEGRRVKV